MMFWRRRDATHSLNTQNFRASSILAMLILLLPILHATHSTEIQNLKNSPSVGPSLRTSQGSQHSVRRTIEDDAEESLALHTILDRLNAAATLRTNMLTSIGRILLLSLDEESRIAFEEIYEGFRSRYVPSYDYLALVPEMRDMMPKQQLRSVLQLMERISTPYISSYATMCLEALSCGKVSVEVTTPTDLLLGIDKSTQNSLAMDEDRNAKVPLNFEEAVSTVMSAVAGDLIEPDLELVATLMVNLPNFDVTNPEVPESLRYVAKYMKDTSKSGDPVLEYLNAEQTSGADKLVKVVLERILISEYASSVLREAVGQLLQNFRDLGNEVKFRTWNTTKLFNVVSPDFYPRSVVAIAKYFQENLDLLYDLEADLTLYATEPEALAAVIRKIARNSSLPEPVRENAAVLATFVAQKAREENPQHSIEQVNVKRALEYLDAFQSPCLPKKLSTAASTLRYYLDDTLPWSYAFGDTRLRGNPYELLVNAMIRLRNIDLPQILGRALDDFIYQTQSSGVTGKRSVIYDTKVIFQRGDTDLVELDVYSLVERLPGVFRDERFTPLLVFASKDNLADYLGHGFNMFAHTAPGSLLVELIKTAIDKQAVREDEALFKALKVSEALLEEPTLVNIYSSETLNDVIKALPIDDDPRYLPIKLLFRKENLFKYIPLNFSLAGLESPLQHVALVLNTVRLKPIDKRLEESIAFALTTLEGSQLPTRSFTRDDFTYLVSHLLARQKKVAGVITKSKIYNPVSKWNIMVSGSPEDVLARALSYPVKELSKNRKLHDVVKAAVKTLGDDTPRKVDLLDKKILDPMLNYIPDTPDLRPVILILKYTKLATLLPPRLNVSYLSEQPPREALIMVLRNLMASSSLKKETVLSRRVKMTLKRVKESVDPPDHDVSWIASEELLNPMDQKYEPLRKKFKVLSRKSTLKDSKIAFRDFLSELKNEKKNPQLCKAASLALQEIDSDDSTQGIEDSEILEALSLLPDDPTVTPLNRLLTTSWIRDILPKDFQSDDFQSSEKILKIILFQTKERPEVLENPGLVNAISAAEQSLVSWKRDVEPLKKVVYAVKDALYDPIDELLKPGSLNKLNLTFVFDSEQTPKQLMIDLLQKLVENDEVKANSQLMLVLDGLQRDFLEFGLDVDLLCTLDDAGIPYRPSLAPVRIFLRTRNPTSRLVRSVSRVSSAKRRFKMIKDSLSADKLVQADEELLESVHELARIKPSFNNPLGATPADMMDIVNALPDEVVRNYPEVKRLLRPKILKQLPFRSAILESGEPVKILLTELSQLPRVSKKKKLSAKVVQLSEALGDFVNQPVISGYNLRPLLRELNHIRQINVDYILTIIDPKMLSVLLPDGLDDFYGTQDDAELLNNILDEVLSQNVSEVDPILLKQVSSMERDLVTVLTQRRKKEGKQLLSDHDVNKMMILIPEAAEFEAIRNLFKAEDGLDAMPQSISSSKYPTPLKRLMKILYIVQRNSGTQNDLHDSVIALKSHLTRQYLFVNERDVEILMDAINGLSVNHDLVPLRLFLTMENLVKYLPSDIELGRSESPRQALKAVLHSLRENEKLENNIMLQQSIAVAVAALREDGSGKTVGSRNAEGTRLEELTIYDLRFLLNLEFESSNLKDYLSPGNLINILPRDFSFASKTTFKSKVLHVLDYLAGFELGPRKEIQRMILKIEMLEDSPVIDSVALERLVALINRKMVGLNFNVIKKYLTDRELVKIAPGYYRLRNDTDVREALIELSVMVLSSLRASQKREIAAFEIFLIQLENPWSPLIKMRPKVTLAQLKSLIAEIPFKTCKNIGTLGRYLKPDLVLKMFPVGFDLAMFKTRKLKLLAILKVVENHRDASKFNGLVQVAKKCVEEMQDAPKLSNWNIGEILNATDFDESVVRTLLENCKAVDLAEHLPITFDNKKVMGTRSKLMMLINYCQKLKHNAPAVIETLERAKTYAEKLPSADLDRIGLNIILNEICCCNFTSIKPLKVFIGTNDLLPLLPPTLNLEKEPTFKHKVLALLEVMRNITEFRSEEMIKALNTAEGTARALPDVAVISEKDIKELKKLDVMMLPEAEPLAKIFVLRNLIKVLPSSFDTKKYISAKGKLARLLDYALQIPRVKTDEKYAEAWKVVYRTLRHQAEKEILDFIEIHTRQDDALTQLLIYMQDHKNEFFEQIWITHGYEYELIDDRVRVVLRYMLRLKRNTHFKCLTKSINLMISRYLSEGRRPTEYEVLHAIDQLPDSDQNRSLKIMLRCKDVKYRAKNTLTLTPKHTVRAILLDMLTMLQSTTVDKETKVAIDLAIPDVEQAIRDDEVKELLKEVPNSEGHRKNLQAVRSYYVLNGPTVIFGTNYHFSSFDHSENLHKLVETLLISPDVDKDKELKNEVEYLNEVLTNPTNDTSPEWQTTIQNIDITPMLSVLPKMSSDELIFGLLKFFTDPKLSEMIGAVIDPAEFNSQGALMQKIIDVGLTLESVKKDPNQLEALKYVRDKILLTEVGALPIKLKRLSKHGTVNPDLLCLFKAIDYRSANLSNVVPITKFFETEYDPLIHGRGFDHTAYHTRGAYLKALLEHLVANGNLQKDIKRHAKVLISFVNLNGSGGEPIDLIEDMTVANRVFDTEFPPGPKPQETRSPDVSAHFRNQPQDPWEKVFTKEPARRSMSEQSYFESLMEKESESSNLFEEERSSLRNSINRMLHSEGQTTEAPVVDPDESVSSEDDILSVSQEQVERSKREVRKDVTTLSRLDGEEPFDPESATFSPDEVLIDVKTRLVKGRLKRVSDEGTNITKEEATKLGQRKHDPVEPLTVPSQGKLPAKTDSGYEAIPHTVSKNLGTIDFVNRKLFIRDDTDASLIRNPRDLSYDNFIENRKSSDRKRKLVKKHWSQLPHARLELDMILSEICCCDFTSIKPFIVFKATENVLALLPQTLDLDKEPTFKHKLLAVLATLRNLKEFQSEEMMIALDTAEEEAYALRDTAIISEEDIEKLKQLDVMMAPEAEPFAEIFVLDNLIKVLPPSFDIDDHVIEETQLARLIEYSMYLVEVKTDDKYADSWRFVFRTLCRQAENEILDFIELYGRVDEDLTSLVVYMEDHREDFFKQLWATHGFEYWRVDDRVRVVLKYMLQFKRITHFKPLTKSIELLISMLSQGPPTQYEILRAIDQLPDSAENRDLKIHLRCKDVMDEAKKFLTLTPEHDYERLLSDLLTIVDSRSTNGRTTKKRYTREAAKGSPEELVILSVSQGPTELSKRKVRDVVSAVSRLDGEEPLDPETATFSPDKVLVDVETRLVKGPLKTEHDEGSYITEEEAAKLGRRKHDPVRPLTVSSQDGLPAETDSEYEAIPHTESKNPGQIDLVSRKLFIRNDTDHSLIRKPRDLSKETLIEDHGNVEHENKTVKKDLSQSPSARCYAKPEIILEYELPDDVSEDTDSVPVPEALTLERSTDLPNMESLAPMIDDEAKVSEDRKSIGHLTDDMTVEDFKAHVMEPPKSPEVRVLGKRETTKDYEKRNTDHIEGHFSQDEVNHSVQATEDERRTIPQKVFFDDYYEEDPVVLEGPVAQDLVDYAKAQHSFIKIEDIFADRIRRKRSSDHGIPVIEAVGENVNHATSPAIHDVAHLSKKDVKGQDDSHLKWEGNYMAGRKR